MKDETKIMLEWLNDKNYYIEDLLNLITNLQERIDKVVEDLKKTKELNDKHILARDNIVVHLDIDHIDYLLNILQGSDE